MGMTRDAGLHCTSWAVQNKLFRNAQHTWRCYCYKSPQPREARVARVQQVQLGRSAEVAQKVKGNSKVPRFTTEITIGITSDMMGAAVQKTKTDGRTLQMMIKITTGI